MVLLPAIFNTYILFLGLVKTFLCIKIGEEKGIREQGERREERGRKNRSRRWEGERKRRRKRRERGNVYLFEVPIHFSYCSDWIILPHLI